MAISIDRLSDRPGAALICQRPSVQRDHIVALPVFARQALAPYGQRPAAHHLFLLRGLAAAAEGRCDRLMVLMPPGSAKSTYVSLLFPVWWLHRHRRSSIIAVSHTAELGVQFGRGVRNLAREHGAALGYKLQIDNHAAHRFATDGGGAYFATGIGGAIAGRRADLAIIDDPFRSMEDADNAALREAVWRWYRGELIPRLKPGARIVLVTTRMHVDDLAGRLLAQKDEWRVLQLPALAERDDPLGREPGEALWPGWEDAAALQRKRDAIGERAWSALYQQCPFERTGHLFRVDRITVLDGHQEDARYVRAWDLAASAAGGGRDPDWTVGLKLGRTGAGRYVIADIVRLRATPYDIEQEIRATAERDGGSVQIGLPQDPGQAGKLQVAWLAGRLSGYRVSASPESGAKHIRALPVAAQIEAGNMGMVRAGWNRALLDELAEFPDGAKDDQVDALTRAFSMLVDTAPAARNTRVPLIAR